MTPHATPIPRPRRPPRPRTSAKGRGLQDTAANDESSAVKQDSRARDHQRLRNATAAAHKARKAAAAAGRQAGWLTATACNRRLLAKLENPATRDRAEHRALRVAERRARSGARELDRDAHAQRVCAATAMAGGVQPPVSLRRPLKLSGRA